MQPIQKQRNSNLELYRIIVMLLIVCHHYVVNSGLMDELTKEPLAGKSIFYYIFGMWGKTGINCFVLITGYFMCKSAITIRKFLQLLLQVLFYSVTIYLLFVATGYEDFSVKMLLFKLVPMRMVQDGFTSCFLWFYLCIPFQTVLVTNLNQRMHGYLVLLCLGIYTLTSTVPGFHVTMNYVSWFIVLFFIASYIRFYGLLPKVSTSKWGGILLVCMMVSIVSVMVAVYANAVLGKQIWIFRPVSDSNTFLAVATSISAFMYFKDLKMKHHKRINTIAASTFGVLLIHANSDTMRYWLWQKVVDCKRAYYFSHSCLYAIGAALAIFAICIVIDYIRIHTIEKWTFHFIDPYLEKYSNKKIKQ